MSKKVNSAEEALALLKSALSESEEWSPSDSNDWEEIPEDEWDDVYVNEQIHDAPEDFYKSHYEDDNPYDDYGYYEDHKDYEPEELFDHYQEPIEIRKVPKQQTYLDKTGWDVHEDGDFTFVEPKYQEPKHDNDHINRTGRLYNEHIPSDITVIMNLFNVANQRYVNDYLISGIEELVTKTIDDDPYQAAFVIYSFALLLTTAKEDEVRSYLFAAIEMLWDAYTNACYGYKFKKHGRDSFLSAMEYNMFYTALNYINFLHQYLYPLEKDSGRLHDNPYSVSKFTSSFLNRDDVKIHIFRIQPNFEDKPKPDNNRKTHSNNSNRSNQKRKGKKNKRWKGKNNRYRKNQ